MRPLIKLGIVMLAVFVLAVMINRTLNALVQKREHQMSTIDNY